MSQGPARSTVQLPMFRIWKVSDLIGYEEEVKNVLQKSGANHAQSTQIEF